MAESLYQAIGGAAMCRKLATAFYARVDGDPLLRPLFPGTTLTCDIEAFTAFLNQFLGGPAEESQRRWSLSLRESHARFRIGGEHRDAWMRNMIRALDDAGMVEPARTALRHFFEESSAYLVNEGQQPRVAKDRGEDGDADRELARRWQVQRKLDEAVAAIRSGDMDSGLMLAEDSSRACGSASVFAGLLAVLIGSGDEKALRYVSEKLARDPSLVQERYAGRTLLHEAAAKGTPTIVELLLQLGADPNAPDGGGHTPLYSLSNECTVSGGGNIAVLLVEAGAKVNANDGVKRCTPLHMAARRGNVGIAEALLECGAAMEARDSLGQTPLRRAVNCNKTGVAALLLSRGADQNSHCKKGLTPVLAVRGPAMKQLFIAGSSQATA